MNRNPRVQDAISRVQDDPDVRLAIVFAAVFAWTLGFVIGFVLGEREGGGAQEDSSR